MSCDHRLIEENLTDFLEGRLAPELARQCEAMVAACPHCAESCDQARRLYRLSEQWQPREVPGWHRTAWAVKPPVKQSGWVSWTAMATSCLAIVLVVLQLEVSTGNGLTISFGGQQAEQRLATAVASAMADYRREQDLLLTARFDAFSEQQKLDNRLLLSEWADNSRQERRDDLNFIMSAWETQRFQDQRQINQRFSSLASNQIESDQVINDLMRNANYIQRGTPR